MIQERKWMVVNRKSSLRCRDAADERQYMLSGDYEVYEKVGGACRSGVVPLS